MMSPVLFGLRVAIIAIVGFILLPAVVVAIASVNAQAILSFPPQDVSIRWFERALTYRDFQRGLVNSLQVMLVASGLALVAGATFAYVLDRYKFWGKRTLDAILVGPLVVPHFVIGLGFLTAAAQAGLARTYEVVIVCHVILVLPFVVRSVTVSLKTLDPKLEAAAASLGAGPTRVLLTVTLPLLAPGIVCGWLFAAILSFNEFTASLFVTARSTQTLPVAMYNYVREYADPSMAALSVLFIALTTAIVALSDRYLGLARVLSVEPAR